MELIWSAQVGHLSVRWLICCVRLQKNGIMIIKCHTGDTWGMTFPTKKWWNCRFRFQWENGRKISLITSACKVHSNGLPQRPGILRNCIMTDWLILLPSRWICQILMCKSSTVSYFFTPRGLGRSKEMTIILLDSWENLEWSQVPFLEENMGPASWFPSPNSLIELTEISHHKHLSWGWFMSYPFGIPASWNWSMAWHLLFVVFSTGFSISRLHNISHSAYEINATVGIVIMNDPDDSWVVITLYSLPQP